MNTVYVLRVRAMPPVTESNMLEFICDLIKVAV